MQKELISPAIRGGQVSITDIPRKLYQHFYLEKIGLGDEVKTECSGETRLWFQLPITPRRSTDKLVAIFTELQSGDSIETKFALSPGIPSKEHYRDFYHFEIISEPESRGWTYGEGNRFIETLFYRINQNFLYVDDPMTDYVAKALIEVRNLLKSEQIIRREFIDHAKNPPH